MKMTIKSTFILSLAIFLLAGAQQVYAAKPAKIRFVNTIPDARTVNVSLSAKKGTSGVTQQLNYKQHTDYFEVEPALYTIDISADGDKLISKEYGLGVDGTYTVIISGLASISHKTNEMSGMEKAKWIFGGAEAVTPNGMLPQIHILRDKLSGSRKKAMTRAFHSAPGISSVKLTGETNGKKIKISKVSYPKKAGPKPLKPGTYTLNVAVGSSKQPEMHQMLDIRDCLVYTFIVVGAPSEKKPLQLLILTNPMEGCRER